MSEGIVRQWYRMFKVGQKHTITMKTEMVGRPSIVSEDISQGFDQQIYRKRLFTTSELLFNYS
jgi:hypothetical protein